MEESSGCCSGCLGFIISIVGFVVGIVWGICKGIVHIIGAILGWIFDKIVDLILFFWEKIKDIYFWIDSICMNNVHLPVWACVLIIIGVLLLLGFVYDCYLKHVAKKLSQELEVYRAKADKLAEESDYDGALNVWRQALNLFPIEKIKDNEYAQKVKDECYDYYEREVYCAARFKASEHIIDGETLEKKRIYLNAAKAYQRAAEVFDMYYSRDPVLSVEHDSKYFMGKYKELVAKHVEIMAKQLDDLDW